MCILSDLKLAEQNAKEAIEIWRSIKKKHKNCAWFILSTGSAEVDNSILQKLSDRRDIVFISCHPLDDKAGHVLIEYVDETQYGKLLTYYSFFKFSNKLICLNLYRPYGQFCGKLMLILNMTADEIAEYILGCNGIA